jgi:hypothetical protein
MRSRIFKKKMKKGLELQANQRFWSRLPGTGSDFENENWNQKWNFVV